MVSNESVGTTAGSSGISRKLLFFPVVPPFVETASSIRRANDFYCNHLLNVLFTTNIGTLRQPDSPPSEPLPHCPLSLDTIYSAMHHLLCRYRVALSVSVPSASQCVFLVIVVNNSCKHKVSSSFICFCFQSIGCPQRNRRHYH